MYMRIRVYVYIYIYIYSTYVLTACQVHRCASTRVKLCACTPDICWWCTCTDSILVNMYRRNKYLSYIYIYVSYILFVFLRIGAQEKGAARALLTLLLIGK